MAAGDNKLLFYLVIQAKWHSSDGELTSRDTFMSVLSEVQAIYVKASYGDGPSDISLRYMKSSSYLTTIETLLLAD